MCHLALKEEATIRNRKLTHSWCSSFTCSSIVYSCIWKKSLILCFASNRISVLTAAEFTLPVRMTRNSAAGFYG